MAKKKSGSRGGVNKSKAIRDYLNANPGAAPKDVTATLGAQGVEVSPQLVSNIKSTMGKRADSTGSAVRATRGRPAAATNDSAAVLLEAKKLIDQVGSVAAARKALDLLEKLRA